MIFTKTRVINGRAYHKSFEISRYEDSRNGYMWAEREANDAFDQLERGFRRLEATIKGRYNWWRPDITRQQERVLCRLHDTAAHTLANYPSYLHSRF
jgi:hypothetical protein